LVAHDTVASDLHGTTIPMEDVVSRLRQSRAGAVLCVLDCCFSGGAPARVLEDSPVPRDAVSPLPEVVGKGRVLIAASNVDEPAYELLGSGHGILTKAIIDVLRGEEEQVSLPTAVDKITSRVRAEAERIGVTQTPVFFNYVEGGLVLPPLKAGENFFRAFPELSGVRVGRDISELAAFGLPAEVISPWSAQFAGGLNDLQLEAVNEQRVLDGASLLVAAPTSAGKTFVGEMAAARAPSPRGGRPPSCCPTGRSSTRSTSSSPRFTATAWGCGWCAARATTPTTPRSSSEASTTSRSSPTRCS
jgi:helicase